MRPSFCFLFCCQKEQVYLPMFADARQVRSWMFMRAIVTP